MAFHADSAETNDPLNMNIEYVKFLASLELNKLNLELFMNIAVKYEIVSICIVLIINHIFLCSL